MSKRFIMEAEPSPSQTVKFDVSGRVFKVSRGLIDQQPGSVLGRMISETWHRDQEEPIFVDRDSDIFAQVLNYLRYGSIVLPSNMPKEMFTRDLGYYGLHHDDDAIIDGDKIVAELKEEHAKKLKAMPLVEITGPGHEPVYARGHLIKDVDFRDDEHLKLHEVSPCLLKDLEAVEIWIGGSLHHRFALRHRFAELEFMYYLNDDNSCDISWWQSSNKIGASIYIEFCLSEADADRFCALDLKRMDDDALWGWLLGELPPGITCSFEKATFDDPRELWAALCGYANEII